MKSLSLFICLAVLVACSTQDDAKAKKLLEEGSSFLDQKNYSSALLAFKDALKYKMSDESKVKNYRNISICFLNLDELDSAKANAKKAYESAEKNSYYYHNNKGEYLLLNKEIKQAFSEFNQALSQDGKAMEVNNNLSLIYSGAYGEAFLDLKKALKHGKQAYRLNSNAANKEQLAGIYFQLENFKEAGELFSELSQEFPQVKMYQFNYGQSLYFSGKEEEGLSLMEEAAERDEQCRELFEELVD